MMPPWQDWQLLATLGASASLLAYINAAEAAFLSVNDVRVQHRAEGGDPQAAFLARHLEDREGILAVLLLASKLASGLLALALLRLLSAYHGDVGRAAVLLLCVCTLFMVLCQRLPSVLGASYADRLAAPLVWPLRHVERGPLGALWWLVRSLVRSTGRFLGSALAGVEPGFKFDELRMLLEASENQGVLDAQSNRMLQAILGLGQIPVRRVMLPLEDTVMVPEDAPAQDAAQQAAETGFSRLPIHAGERSQVTGYVHVIDLLVAAVRDPERRVLELKQEILSLSPDANLVAALRLFRSSRYHMATVVDETGAVGVLTVEDVLERIVGDIEDEHDAMVGAIQQVDSEGGEGEWWTDPHAPLHELASVTGLRIDGGGTRTLGGYLSRRLGGPLESGQELVVGGHRLTVEESEEKSVPRIRIRRLDPGAATSAPAASGPPGDER